MNGYAEKLQDTLSRNRDPNKGFHELGLIEALGSVFLSPAYKDLYGFVLLIALLAVRPTGLFGERERTV